MNNNGKWTGLIFLLLYIIAEFPKIFIVTYAFERSPYLNGFDFYMCRTLVSTFIIGLCTVITEVNVFIATRNQWKLIGL